MEIWKRSSPDLPITATGRGYDDQSQRRSATFRALMQVSSLTFRSTPTEAADSTTSIDAHPCQRHKMRPRARAWGLRPRLSRGISAARSSTGHWHLRADGCSATFSPRYTNTVNSPEGLRLHVGELPSAHPSAPLNSFPSHSAPLPHQPTGNAESLAYESSVRARSDDAETFLISTLASESVSGGLGVRRSCVIALLCSKSTGC